MKKIFYFLLLLFFACSTDNSVTEKKQDFEKPSISLEQISYDEIITNPHIKKELTKKSSFKTDNNKVGKNNALYLEDQNLFIFLDSAKYINSENVDSYTFSTVQGDDENIKNVLFNKNEKGGYDAILVEYDYSWKDFEEFGPTNVPNGFRLTPIDLNLDISSQKRMSNVWVCVYEYIWTPDQGQLVGNSNELEGWVLISSHCEVIDNSEIVHDYSPSYYSSFTSNGETATYRSGGSMYTSPSGGGAMYDENYLRWVHTLKSELGSRLNIVLKNYLDSHVSVTMQNLAYLQENSFSEKSKNFSIEAIRTKRFGGEVNFIDEIIRSSSFKNEPCFEDTYNKLSTNEIATNFFDNFEGQRPVAHLKFTASSFGNNKNAKTHPPDNFVIEIEFNNDKTNRPEVDIARTIMHEVIHAEIFRKLLSLAQAGDLSGLTEQDIRDNKDNYPGIFDYYTRYIYDNPQPSSPHHNIMAQHMITTLQNALMQFDNTLLSSEAEALAWTGLKRGVNGDSNSEIDPQTGLVIDPVTGENESTVAWTNLSQAKRLNLNQIKNSYMQNTQPCQ